MAEITLQQIAELMDQKFTEFKASQDARNDAQDARFDAQDARFDAIDEKLAKQDVRHEQIMDTLRDVVQTVGMQIDGLKADIKREVRVLTEQDEGRKIASLYEESQAHKEKLDDHETRIDKLEAAAG